MPNIEYEILTQDEVNKRGLKDDIDEIENDLESDEIRYLQFSKLYDDYVYALATVDSHIVGMVRSCLNPQETSLKKDGAPIVRLPGVYVHANFRRQGIARKLLELIIDHWRKQNSKIKFTLGVFSENRNAIELYKQCGFVPYITKMVKVR